MMLVDDIVHRRGKEVDMTEYLDTWRKSPEGIGMRVRKPNIQLMHLTFQHN